ncbi:unnamed protein product [Meloidogyne enterolobii]|uniref:Uncharacterized protein n=1 Tax=Meloidogyne enterolobii TaxID=390850 RepID=A0ACB0YN39_MELEN
MSRCFCESLLSTKIPYAQTLIIKLQKIDVRVEIDGVMTELFEVEEVKMRLIDGLRKRFLSMETDKYFINIYIY